MPSKSLKQFFEFYECFNIAVLLQNLWCFADPRYKSNEEDKKILFVNYELLKKMADKFNVVGRGLVWNQKERSVV